MCVRQATKNLVFLAPHLYAADARAGRVPPVAAASTAGSAPAEAQPASAQDDRPAHAILEQRDGRDGEHDSDGEGAAGAKPGLELGLEPGSAPGSEPGLGPGALSLHGLVRRMARLADDRTFPAQRARLAALRFGAALAARLGRRRVEPYLPALLRPLYRITEGAAASPDEVRRTLAVGFARFLLCPCRGTNWSAGLMSHVELHSPVALLHPCLVRADIWRCRTDSHVQIVILGFWYW